MRAFKIFATPKHVFKIVADTFPRLVTLIFNNTNTIKIIGLIRARLKSNVTLKIQSLFTITDARVKLHMLMSNIVAPIRFKISAIPKSIESEKILITITTNIIAQSLGLVKLDFSSSSTVKIIASVLVGQFRLLGELDPLTLGEMDNDTLGTLDFEVQ